MTIQETYEKWKSSLKKPDDSIFYYHKNLERILLGLAIYVISSKPLVSKLKKANMLKLLHLQVPELITHWIDENEEQFEVLFPMVMTVTEGYIVAAKGAENAFPSEKRTIRAIAILLANSCGVGGDMKENQAQELLDDLSTDGDQIYSDKIKDFGAKLLSLTHRYGIDIPYTQINSLNGW